MEASLTIRVLAEVDAARAHSFILSGFTALRALRETMFTEKVGACQALPGGEKVGACC